MNSESLSLRLKAVADYVVEFASRPIRLADIGTDHAYLPVYLILNDIISFAIAGDVAQGPLQSAKIGVQHYSVEKEIDVRLGNGLQVVRRQDNMNTATICGMGGKLMTEILEEGYKNLTENHTLILQPNTGEHLVRQWLQEHQYLILAEKVIEEDAHFYEIIVAQPFERQLDYTPQEILLGPCHMGQPSESWLKKIAKDYHHIRRIIHSMKQASAVDQEKLQKYQLALQYMKEFIDHDK